MPVRTVTRLRRQGRGPFPAILLNHGSGRTRKDLERLGPYERNAEKLGPVFARHGYVFFYLFRRGVGLSTDQGANAVDLMNSESAAHGQEARNALQLQLLENREMDDALSGLKFLRALPYVDAANVARDRALVWRFAHGASGRARTEPASGGSFLRSRV